MDQLHMNNSAWWNYLLLEVRLRKVFVIISPTEFICCFCITNESSSKYTVLSGRMTGES